MDLRSSFASPPLRGTERRLALATAAVDRLAPRVTALGERANVAGRLADRCTEWIKSREPAVLHELVAQMRCETAGMAMPSDALRLTAELTAARAALGTLATERAAVERAPVPLAEAKDRLLAAFEKCCAGGWTFDVARFFGAGYSPELETGITGPGTGLVPHPLDPDATRAWLLALLGDQLRPRLVTLLEREAEGHPGGIAADERVRRLAVLDGKARAAAVREELLVQALELAGVETLRREDADPDVVLGVAREERTDVAA